MVAVATSLDEQYWRREAAIELVNAIGVDYAWKRPDVSEACYHAMTRMRAANDALAEIIARKAVE